MMKKIWKKPKLVGLYRASPNEAVLTNCKQALIQDGDPVNTATACQEDRISCICCDECCCT